MPSLKCDVTTCLHNADKYCCKNVILVEGADAKSAQNTCCSSFDEAKENGFKNEFETKNLALAVDCEAVNCRYNQEKKCKAKHITISGGMAKNMEQTLCATFEER